MRRSFALTVLLLAPIVLAAQPTWSEDVAPIVYANCASCHVEGGIAPFPLISYAQASAMSQAMLHAVEEGEMPPFPADVSYQRYAHERGLSSGEIATIRSWVEGGSPEGNPDAAPEPPETSTGPSITAPDLVVTMPEYTSTAVNGDVYRCFTMPVNNAFDRVLEHVEVVPGNAEIVHHVLVFVDTSDVTAILDARDPGPGYSSFGGVGSNTARLIAAYVPGIQPVRYPTGFGLPLPQGARVIFQVHYPEGSAGKSDQTQFRATFSSASSPRIVSIDPILNPSNMTNGPLVIPPNVVKTFRQEYRIPIDVSILSVTPHMHLLGKSTKIWAEPANGDPIPLVHIPQWDFHWQMVYTFQKLMKLPRNTIVKADVTYDNTADNPENPSDPPQTVRWGEATTDEMILTYFSWVPYRPGDEAISLMEPATSVDETPTSDVLRIAPTPASSYAVVQVPDAMAGTWTLRVLDLQGADVLRVQGRDPGAQPLDVSVLARGRYTVVLEGAQQVLSGSLLVQ